MTILVRYRFDDDDESVVRHYESEAKWDATSNAFCLIPAEVMQNKKIKVISIGVNYDDLKYDYPERLYSPMGQIFSICMNLYLKKEERIKRRNNLILKYYRRNDAIYELIFNKIKTPAPRELKDAGN